MTENKQFQMGFEELTDEMKEELSFGCDPEEKDDKEEEKDEQ